MSKQIRVSPNEKWRKVKNPLNSRASAICNTKLEAIQVARKIWINQWLEMFVQNLNWQIWYRNSYWNDPYPPNW